MNFSELRTEVVSRGFDYLQQSSAGEARIDRWLNQSYQALCEAEDWPFLEMNTTSTAPISFENLRSVIDVKRSDQVSLVKRSRQILARRYPDLSLPGTPRHWYLEGDSLKTYPVDATENLSVRFIRVPSELEEDGDEPLVPSRYRDLIVDGAVLKAYKDTDNFEAYGSLATVVQDGVSGMARTLMDRNRSGAEQVEVTSGTDW